MKFVIVTGMSGAGKSTALKMLEDAGFFCVDNLPIALLPKFAELSCKPEKENTDVAVGIDIRSGEALGELSEGLRFMKNNMYPYEILYLEAGDSVLMKRYKETRRSHPLSKGGRVDQGIALEREKLTFLKEQADYIIDTSQLLTRDLREEMIKIYVDDREFHNLFVTVLSFGFKYGIPEDADLVFDVRFLPNPYYVDELKEKTGNQKEVQDFVMASPLSHEFLKKLGDMLLFLLPNYIKEGKNQLVIAIGCTGGKHRSVTLANRIFQLLEKEEGYGVRMEHRDIKK